jgi:hypothetical protein
MMRTIIKEIETSGVWDLVKIVVSGGSVTHEYTDQIGAQSPQSGRACFLAVEVSAYCVNFHNTDLAPSPRLRTGPKIMIERISLLRL